MNVKDEIVKRCKDGVIYVHKGPELVNLPKQDNYSHLIKSSDILTNVFIEAEEKVKMKRIKNAIGKWDV